MNEEQTDFLTGVQAAPRRGEYVIPDDARIEKCRSCQAQIVWIRTDKGRGMPLSLSTVQTRDGIRYALSHFRDCPDAKDWRRNR